MADSPRNDRTSSPTQAMTGADKALLDLYELAWSQDKEENFTRRKRQRTNFVWGCGLSVFFCFGVVAAGVRWLDHEIDTSFPTWDKTTLLQWPQGIQVQVQEHFSSGMDGGYYTCQFLQSGNEIASTPDPESNEPSPITRGRSQGVSYFFVPKLIGISGPVRTSSPTWVTWYTDDKSLTSWTAKFVAARSRVRKKGKEAESFMDANYAVVKFEVKAGTWIIGLHDADSLSNKENGWDAGDWYGGMPPYLHVESRDSGATWKIREPAVVPVWLDEIHKRY